jgi:Acetylornithine deacetylase/Succinyl-diaminopimelate desuccinylase and related deacylases
MSAITLTQELTRLRSINPPGDEKPCAELLGRLLEAAGLEVSFHSFAEGRTSLIATLEGPDNAPPLCFTGHLDTVPLGAAAWDFDPLGGELDGDRLYGRGASDMKSGVAAMTLAAIELPGCPPQIGPGPRSSPRARRPAATAPASRRARRCPAQGRGAGGGRADRQCAPGRP